METDKSKAAGRFTSDLPFLRGTGFLSENSILFAEYWGSLPKVDLVPSRKDFDPTAIPDLLPTMVIHEVVSEHLIRVRLGGTEVVSDYAQEITGRNYLDFVAPERRQKAWGAINSIVSHPCGMRAELSSTRESGKVFVNESIGLPVRDDNGKSCLVYYQSNSIPHELVIYPEQEGIMRIAVSGRDWFDIGAGKPGFED